MSNSVLIWQILGVVAAAVAPFVTVYVFRRATEHQEASRREERQRRLDEWQRKHELAQARMEGKLDAIPGQLALAINAHEKTCRAERASDYQRINTSPGGVQVPGGG